MSHYEAFIGGMVALARTCVFAGRIRRQGHAERPNWREVPLDDDEAARKALFERMTEEERGLLARLLEEARSAAVHDVLADLEWRTSAGGLSMVQGGESFTQGVTVSMQGDFVAEMQASS
jgi:hypothetical protein